MINLSTHLPPVLYPAANDYGIPDLDIKGQAVSVPAPIRAWGTASRTAAFGGTYHYYTDDYRFAAVANNPARALQSNCNCFCEVNISLFDDTPTALAIAATYKKRAASAEWQRAGAKIIIDLNVPQCFSELNLIGVPPGWSAYSTRAYARRPMDLIYEYTVAKKHSGIDRPLFLVIGGGREAIELGKQYGWIMSGWTLGGKHE